MYKYYIYILFIYHNNLSYMFKISTLPNHIYIKPFQQPINFLPFTHTNGRVHTWTKTLPGGADSVGEVSQKVPPQQGGHVVLVLTKSTDKTPGHLLYLLASWLQILTDLHHRKGNTCKDLDLLSIFELYL